MQRVFTGAGSLGPQEPVNERSTTGLARPRAIVRIPEKTENPRHVGACGMSVAEPTPMRVLGSRGVCLVGLMALAGATLAGCAVEDAGVQTGDAQNLTENEIEGMPAAQFYEQFIYKKVANQDHRYAAMMSPVRIAGTKVYVELELYMRKDASFTASYVEMAMEGVGLYSHTHKAVAHGNWRVEGSRLMLGDLGTAEGLKYNGESAFAVRLSRDIVTPGIAGSTLFLVRVRSTFGPDGND